MGNKKTPLLQKLRNVGGTLYVFPSATEDIGLNLQSTTTGVAMSHFALLNIPALTINDCIKQCTHDITANSGNEALAMSLQNYAMNFETLLTNSEDYNYQKLETISEKVFWHWAMHIGILDPNEISNTSTGNDNIYIENAYNADSSTSKQDNTVIKCFGAIDAGNTLSTEFGMFNETYINIPTSWGAGPVYLKRSDSDNFKLNSKHSIKDSGHLEGRDDSNEYYSYTRGQDYPCYDIKENNVYKYEIYDTSDGFEILKDLNQIQTASRVKFNNEKLIFSSYDDINIDIENNLNIDQEFEFNAILLYYSVYDQDDLVKTAYATNLFGIIFLDGTTPAGDGFIIPTLTKRKSTISQFGNSYSFRVNLKTMSVYDNTDAIIQDNTTMSGVSAVEFSDVISNLNRAIDIMNSNLTTTIAIQDQYASIISYYDNFENDLYDISTCLNAYLKGTRSSFIDTSVLYANEIRTSESDVLFGNNALLIRTHKDTKDDNGNTIYNDPAAIITDNFVNIPILYNETLRNKSSYIINEDDISIYVSINDASNYEKFVSVHTCINTIDDAFTLDRGFNIKLKKYQDPLLGDQTFNELYIDPNSSIFKKSSNENLKCLLDASDNINYVAIIPYIINKIQRINANTNGFVYNELYKSFAEGKVNNALGNYSHAEGYQTKSIGAYSHAEGLNTIANNIGEHAEGTYNITHENTIHSIGIGDSNNRMNAFEVLNNGDIYITGIGGYDGTSINDVSTLQDIVNFDQLSHLKAGNNIEIQKLDNNYFINAIQQETIISGNDYAEYLEWADGNPNNEERIGLFVTLDGDEKIKIASNNDDIIGVISSTPGVIGNSAEQEWHGKYLKDIYGRKIVNNDSHNIINPEYNSNIEYIPRSKRKEWAVVGFMGQFIVNDDGTCMPGKRCVCGENGVATHTASKNGYRVLKRLDETHIKIIASFL